jgi:hypothetical protein
MFVEYKQQCKIKFEPPNTRRILLNMETVKDMVTPKIIAISNRDASTVTIQFCEKKDLVMSNMSSVVEIIL